MIDLPYSPPFGFETAHCNAYSPTKHKIQQGDSNLEGLEMEKQITAIRTNRNATKIIGYIPVLGTAVAIIKAFIFFTHPENFSTQQKVGFAVRIIFEMLSLGILLLIPDLIATAVLHSRPSLETILDSTDGTTPG